MTYRGCTKYLPNDHDATKKITSPNLFTIASKLRKNRRIRFKDLYVIPANIFYKLPKKNCY